MNPKRIQCKKHPKSEMISYYSVRKEDNDTVCCDCFIRDHENQCFKEILEGEGITYLK